MFRNCRHLQIRDVIYKSNFLEVLIIFALFQTQSLSVGKLVYDNITKLKIYSC